MKSPVKFAVEAAAGLVIMTTASFVVAKFSAKANRQAQAVEHLDDASRHLLEEMTRIADAMDRLKPPANKLPRPSLLQTTSMMKPIPEPEPCAPSTGSCSEGVDRSISTFPKRSNEIRQVRLSNLVECIIRRSELHNITDADEEFCERETR